MARLERYTLYSGVSFGISATVTSAALERTTKAQFVGVTQIVCHLFRAAEASAMTLTTAYRVKTKDDLLEQTEIDIVFLNGVEEPQNLTQPLQEGAHLIISPKQTNSLYLTPFSSLKFDFTKDATAATVDGDAFVYFGEGF